MTPYYADAGVTLYHGDALAVLRGMPDASVDCCVTSPPYFGLRDYGTDGQYGIEASPTEYVETMRAVFAEVRRVLADDGTLWLNIGDSYSSSGGHTRAGVTSALQGRAVQNPQNSSPGRAISGVPAKNMLGIPWRVAFALQDDGWILRNDIIWAKPNAMPESVTDRLSTKHEHVFMFAKSPLYAFQLDAVREPHETQVPFKRTDSRVWVAPGAVANNNRSGNIGAHEAGKNPGDVWTIPTAPFSEAHFAVMPQALASRCIAAGCKDSGTVLDPFSGSGTTGLAAAKQGRRYIGIDLSAEYLDLSLRTRLAQASLLDEEPA